jgi:dTDP-4-amino-4,6-dideoxygalactose transaminase
VWHLFVVRSDRRDALQNRLQENGIQTLIHYPTPPHRQAAYRWDHRSFPITEQLHEQVLSLPIGPAMTPAETTAVITALRR